MDRDKITAESMNALIPIHSEELNDILDKIWDKATKGDSSLYIANVGVKNTTRDELEKRGFRVEIGGRYNEINTLIK